MKQQIIMGRKIVKKVTPEKILEISRQHKKPYSFLFCRNKYICYPGVFSPKYFEETEWFAKALPIKRNEDLLEIGCGTGVLSITAVKKGAKKVLSIDINPDAIKNCKENVRIHNVTDKIEVRESNLFDKIKKFEKFDTILWNIPFVFIAVETNQDMLSRSIYDLDYKNISIFLQQSKKIPKNRGPYTNVF